MAGRGPGAADLVRGDAHADAGAADQDAALRPAVADLAGHFERVVRVIDAARVVRPDVDHFVAALSEQRDDALLDRNAAMVAPDGDFHGETQIGRPRLPGEPKPPGARRVTLSLAPGRAKDEDIHRPAGKIRQSPKDFPPVHQY